MGSRAAARGALVTCLVAAVWSGVAAPATGGAATAATDARAGDGPRCDGRAATIVGTADDDHLVGTPGDDVIVGLGGDDRIEAGAGDDVVCALAGADDVWAGPGDDRVFGGIDSWSSDRGGTNRVGDRVWPGPGADYVDLGQDKREGTEYVRTDTLVYRGLDHGVDADLSPGVGRVRAEGVDTVRVHGQLGVIGTGYADHLVGSPKSDALEGGFGNDVLEGRGGDDVLDPDDDSQDKTHPDTDVVLGGNGHDSITSWSGPDRLEGGPGPDFIDTRVNPDAVVRAGSGNDGVSSGIRPRSAYSSLGGPGTDYLFLDYTRRDDLPATTVDLRVATLVRAGLPDVPGTLGGYEQVMLGGDGAWTVYGTDADEEFSGASRVWAFGGDDKVYGTGRDDYVDAGDGTDLVWAHGGTDTCLNAEHVRGCEVTS